MAFALSGTIHVDHTQAGASDSPNFQLLFQVTHATLATVAHGGQIQNTVVVNGQTIPADFNIFTDATQSTWVPFEIVSYDQTAGTIVGYVLLSNLSHTVDGNLFIGYSDPGVTSSPCNLSGLWASPYLGVWHLANGTTLSANDSSGNGLTGSITGATAVAGLNDGAGSFVRASSQFINGTGISPLAGGAFTVLAWAKPNASANTWAIFSAGSAQSTDQALHMRVETDTSIKFGMFSDDLTVVTSSLGGAWHRIGITMNGAKLQNIYLDGVSQGTRTAGGFYSGDTNWSIGRDAFNTGDWFDGLIQSVTVATTARSADWMTADANSQKSGQTMVTVTVGTPIVYPPIMPAQSM